MPPTISQSFPPIDLDELLDGIRQFPSLSMDGKAQFIERLVNAHAVINLAFGAGHKFRRARRLKPGETAENVRDVIWRANVPADAGRANLAGQHVLYLADRQDTALRELDVENDRVVVADFGIKPGQTVRICPVGELLRIMRSGRGYLCGEEAAETVSNMVNACDIREQRSLAITDAFLYEQMVGHDDYKVTALVSKAIFQKYPGVSAIAYSSRRQTAAVNLAVRTESFWDNWCLIGARHGMAEHLSAGFCRLTSVEHLVGVTAAGDFVWEKSGSDDSSVILDPPYSP